ncbi:MAG: ETC complex I subunit [Rickettsiales bacterium]|nr:ETC complex I subunit [Rickettsiales bacterium]
MQARIYKPTKTAMQSGVANNREWLLEFVSQEDKKIEPVMGWTSSSDMLQEVKIKFPTKQAAIEFADSNNYSYEVMEPQSKKFIKRSYADNFK